MDCYMMRLKAAQDLGFGFQFSLNDFGIECVLGFGLFFA